MHFLQCVCTYLDVAPPHAMHFHGSRSTIGGAAGRSFELVADGNGIRQETFKIAIRLLNTNGAFPPPVSVSAFALLALSQSLSPPLPLPLSLSFICILRSRYTRAADCGHGTAKVLAGMLPCGSERATQARLSTLASCNVASGTDTTACSRVVLGASSSKESVTRRNSTARSRSTKQRCDALSVKLLTRVGDAISRTLNDTTSTRCGYAVAHFSCHRAS